MLARLLPRTNLHVRLATSNAVFKQEQKFLSKQSLPSNVNFNSSSSNQKTQKRDWKRTLRSGRHSSKIDKLCALIFVLCFLKNPKEPSTKNKTQMYEHILIDELEGVLTITL